MFISLLTSVLCDSITILGVDTHKLNNKLSIVRDYHSKVNVILNKNDVEDNMKIVEEYSDVIDEVEVADLNGINNPNDLSKRIRLYNVVPADEMMPDKLKFIISPKYDDVISDKCINAEITGNLLVYSTIDDNLFINLLEEIREEEEESEEESSVPDHDEYLFYSKIEKYYSLDTLNKIIINMISKDIKSDELEINLNTLPSKYITNIVDHTDEIVAQNVNRRNNCNNMGIYLYPLLIILY